MKECTAEAKKSTSKLIKLSRNLLINESTLSEASAIGTSIFTQLIRHILTQQFS